MEREQQVKELFCTILKIKDCELDESFLELGGGSFEFTKLQMQIKKTMGKKISLKDLYKNCTVRKMAALFDDNEKEQSKTYLMSDMLRTVYVGRKDEVVMGGHGSKAYFELECEDYDPVKFRNTVKKLVKAQPFFRASFGDDNKFSVCNDVEIKIKEYDLQGLSEKEAMEAVLKNREKQYQMEFDVTKAPLIAFAVSVLPSRKAIIHVTYDGVVSDGEGLEILIEEMENIYDGKEPSSCAKYEDYQAFLSELKNSEEYMEDEKYWEQFIDTVSVRPYIPLLMRPEKVTDTGTEQIVKTIPNELYETLATISKKHMVTPFALLLSVFGKVLSLYSKNHSFFLNVPMALRDDGVKNLEHTVGLFSNFTFVPIRDEEGATMEEMAQATQEALFDCREHGSYLGTDILKLFQKKIGADIPAPITFTSTIGAPVNEGKHFKKQYVRTYTTQNFIEVLLTDLATKKVFLMNYEKNLISKDVAEGIAQCFMETLQKIAEKEDAICRMKTVEVSKKDQALIEEKAVLDEKPETSEIKMISEVIKENFNKYSGHMAVSSMEESITYQELSCRANSFIASLENVVGHRPKRIALLMDKSVEQVVVSVACMCAGISYMPLETELPCQTWIQCLDQIEAEAVVVLGDHDVSRLPKKYKIMMLTEEVFLKETKKDFLTAHPSPEEEAVIINTSGTTGVPKSVSILHKSLANCLFYSFQRLEIDYTPVALAVTAFCHDMSLFDIYGSLYVGGSVVMPSEELKKEPKHWYQLMKDFRVNFWNSVPAFMEMLTLFDGEKVIAAMAELKTVVMGGDFVSTSLVKKIHEYNKEISVFSVGGPTETTLWNISHKVTKEEEEGEYIPYGTPFPNTSYYILNKQHDLCPVGVPGVMHVAGCCVSAGYLGNEKENQLRFTTYRGKRVYNTGDLGLYLPNGEIKILGRDDYQIKINGKRIELTGIENVMKTFDEIANCVVVKDEESGKLAAVYIGDEEINEKELKEKLAISLQSYMVPQKFLRVESFPITRNGKVDRKKIASLLQNHEKEAVKESKKSAGGLTEKLVQALKEIFDDDDITAEDDFYSIGGDSISAMKLAAWIHENYGVEVQVFDILNNPDIAEIAGLIEEAMEHGE
ncbi:MAG: AMP-binding protein [Lachnospiraceae bacterium]|nr:AMP-binding protein [Lachnospiraceae bacterium]